MQGAHSFPHKAVNLPRVPEITQLLKQLSKQAVKSIDACSLKTDQRRRTSSNPSRIKAICRKITSDLASRVLLIPMPASSSLKAATHLPTNQSVTRERTIELLTACPQPRAEIPFQAQPRAEIPFQAQPSVTRYRGQHLKPVTGIKQSGTPS